ncbi:MAG: amidohydrolase family protein [Acutalibacteraceae bacterium]|nr:amidohydrolase family protein [Acutalibacteraceae bacterium]
MIIDAHAHLWKKQNGIVNGKPVYDVGGGKSDFGGEIRQMMPPYMTDGENSVERFLANMDYAGVSGAVITQEYIDGNQDGYLLECKSDRIKICALYEEKTLGDVSGFDGIKICAGRLADKNLLNHLEPFRVANDNGKFISIDLADGNEQTEMMQKIIGMFPDLRIAIGHFGMVTRENWLEQIKLAKNKNVFIESGGITWLFNAEFYPYPSAVKAINEAADLVGFEKLMWGSDYPRTMTAITYKMSLDFIEKTTEISEENKKLILGENARKFYSFADIPTPQKVRNMVED